MKHQTKNFCHQGFGRKREEKRLIMQIEITELALIYNAKKTF